MKGEYDFEERDMPRPRSGVRATLIVLIAAALVLVTCVDDVPTLPNVSLTPCLDRAHFGAPENSPYVLPYPVGSVYSVLQSYCNPRGSHREQLAYDFLLPIGDPIVVARGGDVMEVVDRWPVQHERDLAINFHNAEGPLDERNGLIEGETYLALPY